MSTPETAAIWIRAERPSDPPNFSIRQVQIATEYVDGIGLRGEVRYEAVSEDDGAEDLNLVARGALVDFQAIVFYDLSSISTSLNTLASYLEDFLKLGVRVICLAERIDTVTPEGRVALEAFIRYAAAAKEDRAARTRRGIELAKQGRIGEGVMLAAM